MAEFTLSTQKASPGRGSRGITPSTLNSGAAGRVSAPQLNPTAANIGFQAINIPEMVENQTASSVQQLMSTTAKAAFAYQERESTYYANEAITRYNDLAGKAYRGHLDKDGNYVKGFSESKGDGSVAAYVEFNTTLDKALEYSLRDMEPRVKQKALLRMQADRSGYLKQAALHRATETAKAEKAQGAHDRTVLSAQMAASPYDFNTPDANGSTLKQKYLNTYPEPQGAVALKGWYDNVVNVGKAIYLNNPVNGAQKAADYLQKSAGTELIGSLSHLASLQGSIRTWSLSQLQAEATAKATAIKQAKYEEEVKQDQNKRLFVSAWGNDTQPTPDQVDLAVLKGDISADFGRSYKRDIRGGTLKGADSTTVLGYLKMIGDSEARPDGVFVDKAGNPIAYSWWDNDNIMNDPKARSLLDDELKKKGTEDSAVVNSVMKEIEPWFMSLSEQLQKKPNRETSDAILQARLAVIQMSKRKYDREKILKTVSELYNIQEISKNPGKVGGFYGMPDMSETPDDLTGFFQQNEALYRKYLVEGSEFGQGIPRWQFEFNQNQIEKYMAAYERKAKEEAKLKSERRK